MSYWDNQWQAFKSQRTYVEKYERNSGIAGRNAAERIGLVAGNWQGTPVIMNENRDVLYVFSSWIALVDWCESHANV